MKKVTQRLLAVLLCAVLVFGLSGTASGSSDVYFMAVNDTVVEMTADNMPIVVGGILYVPYIMLSPRDTGINLGVTAQYSTTRRTVLVSGGRKGVIFNPQANNCTDLNGNPLSIRAVVRNSMIYIPLAWICNYFGGISYTTNKTTYGTLIRVTNGQAILSDAEFVDAAANMLAESYRQYLNSSGGSGQQQPGDDPTPSVRPDNGPVVYLALRGGDQIGRVANLLEDHVQRGLFLLTADEMARQDDVVRRLVGAGHIVGLALTGSTAEECAAQLERGRKLLADIARTALTVVCAAEAEAEVQAQLADMGYALWKPTLNAETVEADRLLNALDGENPNYVELSCDQSGLNLLRENLPELAGDGYRLRQAVAPVL